MNVHENKVEKNATIGVKMAGQGKQIPEQRGLSWIKPQMMQQVLSSFALSQGKRSAHFPNQMELLKLFPESRTPSTAASYETFSNGVRDSRSVSESSSERESTAQLTIVYNGAVKVFHVSADEAQAVMKLADSNRLSEKATLKPSHGENEESKNVPAGLPMERKLSLQRFLQKRKGRFGSLTPYASTDNKRRSKVWAEEEEEQIGLSLSFPSQRSG